MSYTLKLCIKSVYKHVNAYNEMHVIMGVNLFHLFRRLVNFSWKLMMVKVILDLNIICIYLLNMNLIISLLFY